MKCRKQPYRSYEKALQNAIRIGVENNDSSIKLKPYKCNKCGKFHLTSNSNLTEKQKANLKKEQEFIRNESEYWEAKFKNF